MRLFFCLICLCLCRGCSHLLCLCLCLCSCANENQQLVERDKHCGNFAHRIWQKSTLSDACLYQDRKCINSYYFTFENFCYKQKKMESTGYPSANYSNLLARVRYTKRIQCIKSKCWFFSTSLQFSHCSSRIA